MGYFMFRLSDKIQKTCKNLGLETKNSITILVIFLFSVFYSSINNGLPIFFAFTFPYSKSSVGRRPSLAGPNAVKIRRSKIWTAELAGQIKGGRPNVRPNLKRTAKCTVKPKTDGHFGGQTKFAAKNFREKEIFISLIWFDRKFRHLSLIWPTYFAVQIFGRINGSLYGSQHYVRGSDDCPVVIGDGLLKPNNQKLSHQKFLTRRINLKENLIAKIKVCKSIACVACISQKFSYQHPSTTTKSLLDDFLDKKLQTGSDSLFRVLQSIGNTKRLIIIFTPYNGKCVSTCLENEIQGLEPFPKPGFISIRLQLSDKDTLHRKTENLGKGSSSSTCVTRSSNAYLDSSSAD
ncbi:hypothetical protein BpHYR1_006717 [Brachionus plicatilis]|uniref:Uncharacterized protein n=1 Tax=Brachionus plicatilis TaxID=10195 RepID=A0A3M7RR57_BRAPC|nr:hypothetical protein BpHYR1_006717 [Brachionus plicatilis]